MAASQALLRSASGITSSRREIQKTTSAAIPHPVKTTKSNGPTESRIGVLRLLPTPSRRYMVYLHVVNATNIDVLSCRLEIM